MAYNFTAASSQYLSASAPVSSHPLTMVCWFRPSNVADTRFPLSLGAAAASDQHSIYYGANNLYFITSIGGTFGQSQSAIGGLSDTWIHAAGVLSANNNRIVYANGVAGGTNTTTVNPSNIDTLRIGTRYFSGSLGAYMNGRIAEVGIWNTNLTAAEVASLAKGMTCDKVRPESLVFYTPLVRDLQDISGGLTITNNNAATVANHPRVYA